ncbi:MAG: methyltransferase [Alphaproteobacteria bacterium]|nr:MAG: methyltransferase [Alphaproteobacteria bacterium]
MTEDDVARTIALALERGLMPPPAGAPYAFLNARPLPGVPAAWRDALVCEQGFRPDYLDLREAGYHAEPVLADAPAGVGGAIVLAGRLRAANEQMIARVSAMLAAGAPVLVAGANRDGIKTLRAWVAGQVAVADSLAKHHCTAFAFSTREGDPFASVRGETISPTLFKAEGVDAGSRLLANFFDRRIAGDVADFGAGSGFLSAELLERGGALRRLDLYEADHLALEAARARLAGLGAGVDRRFVWADLLREATGARYDWIVMNPPFHRGRAADPRIGAGFIAAAAASLKARGRLLMVANRQLPYEAVLAKRFASLTRLAEGPVYKVYEAVSAERGRK